MGPMALDGFSWLPRAETGQVYQDNKSKLIGYSHSSLLVEAKVLNCVRKSVIKKNKKGFVSLKRS